MDEPFLDVEDIVTELPYEICILPMRFSIEQSAEEKVSKIKERLLPGEVYRLDAIVTDATVPVDPYNSDERYNPYYTQNVVFVKKKEF
ncbi:hypothetical protein GOV10_00810 [Candidatus Woesearchaeota archaeon]|nr:hypothetical protein [Candidatus Woesearchaeota archaeon]